MKAYDTIKEIYFIHRFSVGMIPPFDFAQVNFIRLTKEMLMDYLETFKFAKLYREKEISPFAEAILDELKIDPDPIPDHHVIFLKPSSALIECRADEMTLILLEKVGSVRRSKAFTVIRGGRDE